MQDPRIQQLSDLIATMAAEGYVFEPSEFEMSEFYVGKGEPTAKLTWPLSG